MTASYRNRQQQSAVIGLVVAAAVLSGCRGTARSRTPILGRPVAILRSVTRPAPPVRRMARPAAPPVASPTMASPGEEYFPEPVPVPRAVTPPLGVPETPVAPMAEPSDDRSTETLSEPPDAPQPPADEPAAPMVPETPDVPSVPDFEMPLRTPSEPPSRRRTEAPA